MALNILMTYVEECHSWNFVRKLSKTIAKTFGWIAVPKMFLVKADSLHYCNFREETFLLQFNQKILLGLAIFCLKTW